MQLHVNQAFFSMVNMSGDHLYVTLTLIPGAVLLIKKLIIA
jgi:hypothetical protein